MKKIIILILSIFILNIGQAQELLAEVSVDYSQVQTSSTTAYTALEKSLKDFINTTKWTDQNFKIYEKIECSFNIIISEKTGSNTYEASLLVQSRRPVFNSNYYTPILNLNDKKFNFEYTEYEQLIFNERKFSGKNLTDVIGYYVYLILGYDADTFKKEGGTSYFKICQKIAANAQGYNNRFSGWAENDGLRNRTRLIDDLLNSKNKKLRNVYYTYHRNGLDTMSSNELNAKNTIGRSLLSLKYYETSNNYTQNYPLDIFFSAKRTEISQIFSGGLSPSISITNLKTLFDKVSPINSDYWDKMK